MDGRDGGLAIGEAQSELVAIVRPDRVLYLNPAARACLAAGRDPLTPFELLARDEHDRARAAMARVLATGEPAAVESYRAVRPDGRAALLEVTLARVTFDDAAAVLVVGRDVTARHEAEAQQRQAELVASLATLTGGVVHALNNPLAYITMNLTAMGRSLDALAEGASAAQAPLLAELGRLVAETSDGIERVVSTVRELKLFARGAGDTPEPVDVRAVLEATLNLLASELRQRGRLRLDYGELPPVYAPGAQVAQLLLGLLAFAVRGMAERSRARNELRVAARGTHGGVEITVADNGGGLGPDALARLFEPATGRAGLAGSRALAVALGGRLDAAIEPGEGTTFALFLPCNEPMPRRAGAAAAAPATTSRPRLLIVDDEPNLVRALSLDLERDHDVTGVTSGREALELALSEPFDLILCDLMLPELSGMDLHAELARRGEGLEQRLLFMTGGALSGAVRGFLDATQQPWIEKPFRMDRLRQRLAEQAARLRKGL